MNANPDRATEGTVSALESRRSPLLWFCLGYYTLATLFGARGAVVPEGQGAMGDLLLSVALALCLALWAVADARRRRKPIPRSMQMWFLLFSWLVVPGYVIITRGWKGLGWVVAHLVGWFLVAALALHVAGFIYFGNAWWPVLGFPNE